MNEIERAIEYIENHIPMNVGECMVKALEKQLNNGWISCSERLPESDNWYIITVGKNRLVYCDYYDAKHREWDGYSFTDVVAWKKMPESYKE